MEGGFRPVATGGNLGAVRGTECTGSSWQDDRSALKSYDSWTQQALADEALKIENFAT
jgi:hypothetical protein